MKIPPADLLAAAKAVLPHAYTPYSHFAVAASVRAEDGTVFSGCNVENAAFPMGMCAEVGAITALFSRGYRKITEALVLVADHKICSPCGACRQRFLEHASAETVIHLCTMDGKHQTISVHELLPLAFGPDNLEKK